MESSGRFLQGAARLLWDEKIGTIYQDLALSYHEADQNQSKSSSCPACRALWVPGVTCTVKIVTNNHLNKKGREKRNKKLDKYLKKCQKYKNFQVQKQLTLQYRCGCSHISQVKVTLPQKDETTQKPIVSKSKAAKDRAKKRKQQNVDASVPGLAALSKPSLSLNDFLL